MQSKLTFYFIIAVLFTLGFTNIYYRHTVSNIPLTAGEKIDIWKVEAEINFDGLNKPVVAKLTLPTNNQFEIVNEFTASPAYGTHVNRKDNIANVVWSKRQVSGEQTLYYQATLKRNANPQENDFLDIAPPQNIIPWTGQIQKSAQLYLNDAYEKSGNDETLAIQLYRDLSMDNQYASLVLSKYSMTDTYLYLLQMAGVKAYPVKALLLEDGRRNQRLTPLIKVVLPDRVVIIDVNAGNIVAPETTILWQENSKGLLDLEGGKNSTVTFSTSYSAESALSHVNPIDDESAFGSFSLYQLPISEQNLFKGILLLPIGTFVVVFLRILIGIRCSGTFMPILIASSFIQTNLTNGLIGFLVIVSAGLFIRSYLSNLNLLLVSRISAVVILVISMIAFFTILGFKLGLTQALTITYFPMIILAWTIERMSILWEEEGPKEVFIQGSGSLFVATLAYLMMSSDLIRHWAFNFLGIHAIIMALVLMLGQYTGYRLLELRRFKPLEKV